jgi:hypothetical protein
MNQSRLLYMHASLAKQKSLSGNSKGEAVGRNAPVHHSAEHQIVRGSGTRT